MRVDLFRLTHNGSRTRIAQFVTNSDGRTGKALHGADFAPGMYEWVFYTGPCDVALHLQVLPCFYVLTCRAPTHLLCSRVLFRKRSADREHPIFGRGADPFRHRQPRGTLPRKLYTSSLQSAAIFSPSLFDAVHVHYVSLGAVAGQPMVVQHLPRIMILVHLFPAACNTCGMSTSAVVTNRTINFWRVHFVTKPKPKTRKQTYTQSLHFSSSTITTATITCLLQRTFTMTYLRHRHGVTTVRDTKLRTPSCVQR